MSARPPQLGIARNEGAPDLVQWTGERMLPWTDDPALAYEHLHRYLFAARLAAGKRVLDIGCGEGYGSALLASTADTVVGVDIDEQAIAHARLNYPSTRLRFERESADDLSSFEAGTFDVVTCFEVIEHVDAQERVIAEARRVLADGGVLVCSTPERVAYRARTGEQNPYHVRELDHDEFRGLLASAFSHLAVWSQTTMAGSLLEPLAPHDRAQAEVFHVGRINGYWDVRQPAEPLYLVAVASEQAIDFDHLSVLVDPELQLFEHARQLVRTATETRDAEIRTLVESIDNVRQDLLAAGDAAAAQQRRIAELEGRIALFESIEQSLPYRGAKAVRTRLRGSSSRINTVLSRWRQLIARALERRRQDG